MMRSDAHCVQLRVVPEWPAPGHGGSGTAAKALPRWREALSGRDERLDGLRGERRGAAC